VKELYYLYLLAIFVFKFIIVNFGAHIHI